MAAVAALAALAAVAAVAGRPAPASAALTASAASPNPGWIGLRLAGGAPGELVRVREGAAELDRLRLDGQGAAVLGRVARWTCTAQVRALTVDPRHGPDVHVTVETPGCGRRLALRTAPRRPRAGRRLTVRVIDRWQLGRLALCVRLVSPAGEEPCRAARPTAKGAVLRLRAPRPGRWSLQASGTAVARSAGLRVRPDRGRLSVLATGDSMMSPVARRMPAVLPSVQVQRDVYYGAGISNSFVLDWLEHARDVAPRWRPDVVALFIGGHEGYPIRAQACCDRPWVAAYAARTRAIARAYVRRGAAQVYVLSMPAPREASRTPTVLAVNAGLTEGVAGLGPRVRLLDMSAIFTPGFLFRSDMVIGGQLTTVRTEDGLHLTHAGGTLAAHAVAAALAADGVVTSPGAAAGRATRAGRARAAAP